MSTTPNTRPQAGPSRPGAPTGGGGGAVTFDPVKLLLKYKYVLVGAVFVGGVLGVASHFVSLKFFPKYESTVLFQCSPVETDIFRLDAATIDEDEMARFMGTQVEQIKGERVMNAVLADPRLASQAPEWYSKYEKRGRLDIVEAYEDFEKIIRAAAVPNTYLIELSVRVGDKEDAAGIAGLVRDVYRRSLDSETNSGVTQRKEQIRRAITDSDSKLAELQNRKNRILQEQGLDTIDTDNSAEAEMLRYINAQIINIQQQIEAYQVLLADDEAQLQKETAITFDATLRERVEQYPQILTLKQRIIDYKSNLIALERAGIGREHRSYKLTEQTLEATQRQLDTTREQLLLESFETRVDTTRKTLSQLRAQIEELSTQKEELALRLNELTQLSEEIEEINRQIENTLTLKGEHEANLSELNQSAGLATASRIEVAKSENVPDKAYFPQLIVMVPAGIFLTTAFVAGLLVVFEMLDQRVKSAADIAMIPRTPILGIIPDAEEDPAKHASLDTVFTDSPNSVMAEHYRQLRTKLAKKMMAHGHKTLLVVGAMPGSGATSVATNLAQACLASGKKVLVIDTNFRRARIHNAFGLQDSPGLAEILAGDKSIEESTRHLESGLDVITAGARNMRVVERLGTDKMGQVLAETSANYDIVLIDVAPAIVAGDAMTLANHVDATILVARAMQEKRGQVARLKNELSDTRAELLGVLVNGVKSSAGGYMRKNIRTSHQYHADEAPQAI